MSWSGVKKQSHEQEIKSWCDKMEIKNYTINSQGEIDVDGSVVLANNDFKEIPYKFGTIKGYFSLRERKNLISLKNCPNYIIGYNMFDVDGCTKLNSLEGCPKKVGGAFFCRYCKRKFTEEEVMDLCSVNGSINN